MMVALVVESGSSRQSRKNSKQSQQETTHSTGPSWNQYVSSHQPNHVSPSAFSCTHAAQLKIHQSKTMAELCLSVTQRAHNQSDTLIEMHHCPDSLFDSFLGAHCSPFAYHSAENNYRCKSLINSNTISVSIKIQKILQNFLIPKT